MKQKTEENTKKAGLVASLKLFYEQHQVVTPNWPQLKSKSEQHEVTNNPPTLQINQKYQKLKHSDSFIIQLEDEEPSQYSIDVAITSQKSQSEEQTLTDEADFGNEKLFQIPQENMNDLPHKHIGAIISKCKGVPLKGTGLLVSPNLVLTCAHNLYIRQYLEYSYDIKFYPGQCGPLQKYYEVQSYYVPPEFLKSPKAINDYALIKLKQTIESSSFIELNGNLQKLKENLNTVRVEIFGYPSNQYIQLSMRQDKLSTQQWGLSRVGCIDQIRQKQEDIVHKITTFKGQSGAPILLNENQKITVIGIHKGALNKHGEVSGNLGRLITPQLIQILKLEAINLKAELFTVSQQEKPVIPPNNNNEQQYFSLGLEFYHKKQFQESIINFLKAVQTTSQQIQPYYYLGLSYKELQQSKEAMTWFNRTLEKDPSFTPAKQQIDNLKTTIQFFSPKIEQNSNTSLKATTFNRKGLSLMHQKQPKEAITYFLKAIQINKKCTQAYYNIGIAYRELREYELALEWLTKAIDLNPTYIDAYFNLGLTFSDLQQNQKAIECYQKVLQINPKYVDAYINLGNEYFNLEKIKEAKDYYQIAFQKDPGNRKAHYNYGVTLAILKLPQKAIDQFKTAIIIDPNSFNSYDSWINIINDKESAVEAFEFFVYIKTKYQKCTSVLKAFAKLQTKMEILDKNT